MTSASDRTRIYPSASPSSSGGESAAHRRLLCILLCSVTALGAFGVVFASVSRWNSFASYLFSQDLLVLSGLSVLLIFMQLRGPLPACGDALAWTLAWRWTPAFV